MNTPNAFLKQSLLDADAKLSLMSCRQLRLSSVETGELPLPEVTCILTEADVPVSSVGMTLLDDPPLRYLMVLSEEGRNRVVAAVAGPEAVDDGPLAESVLQELGNIFGSTIANWLARLMNDTVTTSVPEVVTDLAGAVLSTVLSSIPSVDDEVWVCDVTIDDHATPIDCKILLFFDEKFNGILEGAASILETTGGN